VAVDADGDFVVAWSGWGQDGFGLYARRYDSSGNPQGSDFSVTLLGSPTRPAVAMDADGDFVVTWVGYQAGGSDIYARRYNAAGVAQTGAFLVNTQSNAHQQQPAIAMNASGDFLIAWTNENESGIKVQRYNAAATAQGSEIAVDPNAQFQGEPAVAMEDNGDFVVVWTGDPLEVYARRFAVEQEPAPYPGDCNRDGKVDAADYVVWRRMLGATGLAAYSGADGDGDGDVDSDDLAVWKSHFGDSVPPGAGVGTANSSTQATLVVPRSTATAAIPRASTTATEQVAQPTVSPKVTAATTVTTARDLSTPVVQPVKASAARDQALASFAVRFEVNAILRRRTPSETPKAWVISPDWNSNHRALLALLRNTSWEYEPVIDWGYLSKRDENDDNVAPDALDNVFEALENGSIIGLLAVVTAY
jgi:hypothetical protein